MSLKANELGDLQMVVLRALWQISQGTVYMVLDAITRQPIPAYTTVSTALRSLEKRGLVEHIPVDGGRQFQYRPLVTEVEAEQNVLDDLVERFFEGSVEKLVERLIEREYVGMSELNALRCLVDQRMEEHLFGSALPPLEIRRHDTTILVQPDQSLHDIVPILPEKRNVTTSHSTPSVREKIAAVVTGNRSIAVRSSPDLSRVTHSSPKTHGTAETAVDSPIASLTSPMLPNDFSDTVSPATDIQSRPSVESIHSFRQKLSRQLRSGT